MIRNNNTRSEHHLAGINNKMSARVISHYFAMFPNIGPIKCVADATGGEIIYSHAHILHY